MAECTNCGSFGFHEELFTYDGTCMQCGIVDDDNLILSARDTICYTQTMLVCAVRYDPRFYIKERLNNWRCICPVIPNEHFRTIIFEITREIGSLRGFPARSISRSLIYHVINRLYGSSRVDEQGNSLRSCLVYRERWLYIKRWMCLQHDVFEIPDADEWLLRYAMTEPTPALISKIEWMMQILEVSFKDILYAEKREGIKRHNRPRRDVAILFLLFGLHPGLIAVYGTDYWKPPATKKSQDENTTRFKILLQSARERYPMCRWPKDDVTLDTIMSVRCVEYDPTRLPEDVVDLFPFGIKPGLIIRKNCEIF